MPVRGIGDAGHPGGGHIQSCLEPKHPEGHHHLRRPDPTKDAD
jgi:hypothetical protein